MPKPFPTPTARHPQKMGGVPLRHHLSPLESTFPPPLPKKRGGGARIPGPKPSLTMEKLPDRFEAELLATGASVQMRPQCTIAPRIRSH